MFQKSRVVMHNDFFWLNLPEEIKEIKKLLWTSSESSALLPHIFWNQWVHLPVEVHVWNGNNNNIDNNTNTTTTITNDNNINK